MESATGDSVARGHSPTKGRDRRYHGRTRVVGEVPRSQVNSGVGPAAGFEHSKYEPLQVGVRAELSQRLLGVRKRPGGRVRV
jgi:hypothetical protein